MSELISGKEALIALANGEEVEFKDGMLKWQNIKHHMHLDLSMFLTAPDWMNFRLKPKTIPLNGIEVPAPFEPKEGDVVFVLDNSDQLGFSTFIYNSRFYHVNFGTWRTEDEIKQVIAALRSVFKTN